MSNLEAQPSWDDVWQWDEKTPLLGGGPDAPLNRQAQALANRTAQLKSRVDKSVLSYPDYAAASAAAATLPDGQLVVVEATKSSYYVASGGIVFKEYLPLKRLSLSGDGEGSDLVVFRHKSVPMAAPAILRNRLSEELRASDLGELTTQNIQAGIDYLSSTPNGGSIILPAGDILLTASTLSESWETYGPGAVVTPISASAGGLILRDKVTLQGAGMGATRLYTAANSGLEPVMIDMCPNGYGIKDLTIDGNWDLSSEINNHGIYWLTRSIADEVNNVFADGQIFNVKVKRVGSYGFGVQNGVHVNNLFFNCKTEFTGADGLDVKSRYQDRGNRIIAMNVSAFGLRPSLVGQAGIDVRGEGWAVIAPRVVNFGRADTFSTGVRLNPGGGTNGNPANHSYVSDFTIEATNPNGRGVESFVDGATIGPGSIIGCNVGVWNRVNADSASVDTTVVGVTVDGQGAEGNAFASEPGSKRTRWIACTAKNISQGFRPAGVDEQIIGCAAGEGVTLGLSKSGAATGLSVTASPTLQEETRAPSFLSEGPINIADDSVVFIPTSTSAYQQNALIGSASAGAGHPNGLFLFRTNESPQCTNLAVQTTANVIFRTGVMTGTTGTDGDFSISAASGGLYLENRTGATKRVVLTFFSDR